MQRNKQVAMGRKKFNMDPKKVSKEDASSRGLGLGPLVSAHVMHGPRQHLCAQSPHTCLPCPSSSFLGVSGVSVISVFAVFSRGSSSS